MGVRITTGEDLVGENHHKGGSYCSRPSIPLPEQTSDALIKLPHGIFEKVVEHDGLLG